MTKLLGCLGFAAAASLFFGWVFMLLWNWIVVEVFHAPVLTLWQAWGLWFLVCLVGSVFRSHASSAEGG